ncbi:MAG: GT-D fold domain-containing glycosyltransferase [Anaerobutyricum sp.]
MYGINQIVNRFITQLVELKGYIKIYFKRRKMKVLSIEETISEIILNQCSVSRFGDGEFYIMDGIDIRFQSSDRLLRERLIEIIHSQDSKCLICIGSAINPLNYRDFTKNQVKWYKVHYKREAVNKFKYLEENRTYYNLLISRFWIPLRNKERAMDIALSLKKIWENRDLVIIEGYMTRMGVGNDLFSAAKSCRRILCPAENAFKNYTEILNAARKFPKDMLFLIALGPTATVLAYDLHINGYQAIDIGHIDLEYEWMKAKSCDHIKVKGKYVNEVEGGNIVDDCFDEVYLNEIVDRIC